MAVFVEPYQETYRDAIVALSIRAWAPVFAELQPAVAAYVYQEFYPDGWQARQSGDIGSFLISDPHNVRVAIENGEILGWVGLRLHPEDSMGEIYILAVDPCAQRKGVARLLLEVAFERLRNAGMKIAMVETGDDPGHASSRATYEKLGFERWPVARYFRKL